MNNQTTRRKTMCINKWKRLSNLDIFLKSSFDMKSAAPRTKRIFDILDPRTFPMEISGDFFIIASIETISSGSDVPNPITMRPIKKSETPYFFPIATALDIRMSAPLTTRNSPTNNARMFIINMRESQWFLKF